MASSTDSNMHNKRVTLRDVAREAGVSLKTASNVINGTGRMAQSTRDHVQGVIDTLGYRVNIAARNLNRNHTGFITLAVPSLTPPYLAELANRVIDEARLRNYSVYVTTYAEGSAQGARELIENFNSTVSDGMILSMSEVEEFHPEDLETSFPLVCVGARTTWGKADHVALDDVQAASRAASYLFDCGSKQLAVVGMREKNVDLSTILTATEGNAQLRARGVVEECARRGLDMDERLLGYTGQDWTIGSGYRVTERLLESKVPFDGIVALNDQLAIGAMSALRSHGVEIPSDVQVIGFDNIEESAYLQTPLTTMDSRLEWIAPTAVDRILGRIDGSINAPEDIIETADVIVRKTTR
ncbi:LacI family DNA-binding transcriptional regulator [Alloscardovia omnicolens]|uniref:LacI family DNA-binding transcriptional regulator n=1 Tax=Alloscardovia omnicolens TaxID=419015 RepID=UPI002550ABAE|nr:LacI family DNA-binding transcriptional regulator [Alloscardovia omnicolens]MDK6445173.1 LacI family DNA-binding transcriptional regulator [Alloscardovia omnicolens]MDK6522256.1 LacI family DNA-binding transcriptional regulator [Alloscardovia omnicolens]